MFYEGILLICVFIRLIVILIINTHNKKMIKKNRMLKELSFQQLKTQQKKFTTFVSILSILTMLTLAAMIYFFSKTAITLFLFFAVDSHLHYYFVL